MNCHLSNAFWCIYIGSNNNLIVLQPFAGLFLVLSTTVGMLIALKIFYKSVKSCQELEHYFSFKTLSKYTLLHDRL